ncbi:GerA spore germination protein [Paenibacillus sp. UNC496MF]|uniref:spore germination protein n=1 Tax=Paenibacillus sp. UNC496MF TaxID=1502753 RepID=UPI0008F0427A|nr:spore germination protein [Paenibacillus sp. UNC496MF]SFJ76577.1 GerA spore germination protein [Paenibacillus sp. UNC496MF]
MTPNQQQWTRESIKQLFRQSADLKMERYELGDADHWQPVFLLYCDGLAATKHIDEVLRRLDIMINQEFGRELDSRWNVSRVSETQKIVELVFSGHLLLYLEKLDLVYALDISSPPHRAVDESNTEIAIKGPRDAFVEELDTNVALVRKRLRTNSLHYEQFSIGKRSQTKVALLYIEDITQPRFVEEARKRLQRLNLDILSSSSQLEELLADRKITLFPLLHYTTRPDFVVDCLIRGRFAVLVDGAPTAIIGPANLTLLLKTPEDGYIPFYMGTFGLWFRFAGLAIGLLLPGFWIAAASFNIEQIPYPLVATISMSRIGLPLPAQLEGFLMMGLFELFREASERLPKAVGQTVAVVGGIVVGDAAIKAGLASTTFLVISSVTAVASFTLVNQSLVGAVTLIRLFVMLCSSTLGMFGFILSTIAIVVYLSTLESFGVPYLSPLTPIRWKDFLSALVRKPWILKNRRAEILETEDSTRQGEGGQ